MVSNFHEIWHPSNRSKKTVGCYKEPFPDSWLPQKFCFISLIRFCCEIKKSFSVDRKILLHLYPNIHKLLLEKSCFTFIAIFKIRKQVTIVLSKVTAEVIQDCFLISKYYIIFNIVCISHFMFVNEDVHSQ